MQSVYHNAHVLFRKRVNVFMLGFNLLLSLFYMLGTAATCTHINNQSTNFFVSYSK